MNKNDRKELEKALELLNEAFDIIEQIKDGEREKFDNLPEGIQQSEKGEKFDEIASNLEFALDQLDESRETINETISS